MHWGESEHWTPYPDDPVFQKKLSNFVKAFAEEYDNPDIVDFIDGYALGWWGECHHIELQDPSRLEEIFDWYTTLYSSNFKNIILALPFGSQVGFEAEKRIAIDGKGYAMRRDGLGSMWFSDEEKKITKQMFGKTLFIGESCWWGCSTDDCRPWKDDPHNFKNWRDVYELTYQHAIGYHFNTLDLREVPETEGWRRIAPDLVHDFMIKGGYRIYLTQVSLPGNMTESKGKITHTWKNTGTGYLPNNHPNWNYKYKTAFALLKSTGEVVKYFVDHQAEPSSWIDQKEYTYNLDVDLNQIPKGKYQWAVSIVDVSKNNIPGIKLSMKDVKVVNGWYILQDVTIY